MRRKRHRNKEDVIQKKDNGVERGAADKERNKEKKNYEQEQRLGQRSRDLTLVEITETI